MFGGRGLAAQFLAALFVLGAVVETGGLGVGIGFLPTFPLLRVDPLTDSLLLRVDPLTDSLLLRVDPLTDSLLLRVDPLPTSPLPGGGVKRAVWGSCSLPW